MSTSPSDVAVTPAMKAAPERSGSRRIAPVVEELQARIAEREAKIERLKANPQPDARPITK